MYGIANGIAQEIDKATEITKELKQSIADVLVDVDLWGPYLSSFLKKVSEHPDLSGDPLIQNAMKGSIPSLLDTLNTDAYDFHPWEVVLHIKDIPLLMEADEIQDGLLNVLHLAKDAIWDDWVFEVLPIVGQIPYICKDPELRVIVAYQCHTHGDEIQNRVRRSDEWMSTSLIRAAVGDSLESVSNSKYEQEIVEYCSLLETYEEPWLVLDLVKDVPRIWKDARIQTAIEGAVPRIAQGIREANYPLRQIVRSLLVRDAEKNSYAGAPWVFKHDEINKAIRESSTSILEDLENFSFPLRENLTFALWDAGLGKEEVEVPRILGTSYDQDHRRFYGIVDVMGWDYVTEKIEEQLKQDSSYADILVKHMPLNFDHYFDERTSFPREFGFRLVPLLFPYKPTGYVEAMKVVYGISWSAKGHEWVWEKYEEELKWVEKEANLRPEDFM